MWNLNESLPRLDGAISAGSSGFYAVLEQSLWSRPIADGKTRTLAGYLQGGTGDEQTNPYMGHLGGGLVLSGPSSRRTGDGVGIAASWVHLGDRGCETVVETYYKLSLGRAVSLISDLQYFMNPGGSGAQSDALVVTPRLVVAF